MAFYVLSLLNHPIKCCCTIFWSFLENPVRNMAAYRKSNKKNTRRKKTQFKKGHTFTSTVKEPYTDNSSSASVSVLQRPTSNEFADALSAQSTSKCDVYVLPTKLRPVKIEDGNDNDFEISEESEENIIINLNKLSKLISAFLPHEFQRARPSVKVVKRRGLCITVEVFCRNCSFISDAVDLFTTVCRQLKCVSSYIRAKIESRN